MRRWLSGCLGPLLLGGAMGAVVSFRSVHACSPGRTFWVLEKAASQPEDALADAALWPASGQLGQRSLSLNTTEGWVSLDYEQEEYEP